MKPKSFMLIAGEPSGDSLGAELAVALRRELAAAPPTATTDAQPLYTSLEPRFFGAGGPQMAAAGVDLSFDMTAHSVIGLSDVIRNYLKFRRLFYRLYQLALDRQPDAIICIDFSGFNRRFARAIRRCVRPRADWFHDWRPRIIQYVSPQVWASREDRAYQLARDYDLLLSIFPFEKEWYARRVPHLRVEFVGNPITERYRHHAFGNRDFHVKSPPTVLLLPGSRPKELTLHLPVMLATLGKLRDAFPGLRAQMVLPSQPLADQARALGAGAQLEIKTGGLPDALAEADLAVASTGTVTLECAVFGVPTVAIYKTSWSTYQVGKRIVKVRYLAMPNLLAGEELFPEFIQDSATAENIAPAGIELLRNENLRMKLKARLAEIIPTLGGPGASLKAARAILDLVGGLAVFRP